MKLYNFVSLFIVNDVLIINSTVSISDQTIPTGQEELMIMQYLVVEIQHRLEGLRRPSSGQAACELAYILAVHTNPG